MTRLFLVPAIALLLALPPTGGVLSPRPALAVDFTSIDHVIVLDLSGSMERETDLANLTLKDLAKQTAFDLLARSKDYVPDGRSAVVLFGHRLPNGSYPIPDPRMQAESCRDIETLSPGLVANQSAGPSILSTQIANIREAMGQTPIRQAIAQAAGLIASGHPGRITVVTDLDKDICGSMDRLCDDLTGDTGRYSRRGIAIGAIVAIASSRASTRKSEALSTCLAATFYRVHSFADAERVANAILKNLHNASQTISQTAPMQTTPATAPESATIRIGIESTPTLFGDRIPDGIAARVTPDVAGGTAITIPPGASRKIAPGKYALALVIGGQPIGTVGHMTAEAGGSLAISLAYGGEPMRVATSPRDDSSPTSWTITASDGATADIVAPELVQTLPPGHYRVSAVRDGKTGALDVDLPSGSRADRWTLTLHGS